MPITSADIVKVRIRRFDPSSDTEPRYEEFEVPYTPKMRVLDALDHVHEKLAIDIGYRWFCGVQRCGGCAVRVNGRELLACWEPAERDMVIEPLQHAPVVRDLVVDRGPFEDRLARMQPWLARRVPHPGFPEPITHKDMAAAVPSFDCIGCLACQSACPVLDLGAATTFAGPALLVQFAQQALDPRDTADRGRIAFEEGGIFECISCYKCEEVCPVEIPIVERIIEPLKALAYRAQPDRARHANAFLRLLAAGPWIDPAMLVLKIQGLAAIRHPLRALKLVLRGKIRPMRTLFGSRATGAAAADVRRLLDTFDRRR